VRSVGAVLVGLIALLGSGVAAAMAWLTYECGEAFHHLNGATTVGRDA
jgi:hypothetical protein